MAVPSGIIIAWVLADTIPTNWSRVTTMDDRFGKGTTGSPAPNAETVTPTHIHDSATHLHDAAHNHTGTTPVPQVQVIQTVFSLAWPMPC